MTSIQGMDLNETQKKILTLIIKPRTTYQIAVKIKKSYSYVTQQLGLLNAMGYVKKMKKMSGGVIYQLAEGVTA